MALFLWILRDSFTISLSTQALALLLPLVTGLAAWSIWLRVADYGWTPDRVLAACVSAVLLGYGLLYALAVLRRLDWSERIRRVNVGLALVTIAISAAFLTPLLNTDRISANNQVSRYLDGRLSLDDLPLWQMQNEWGRAGQAAIAILENSSEGPSAELAERLQKLRSTDSHWAFVREEANDLLAVLKSDLIELLPVLPAGQVLKVGDLQGLGLYQLRPWVAGCRRILSDGRPGCVLVLDQFLPNSDRQGLLLYRNSEGSQRVKADHLILDALGQAGMGNAYVAGGEPQSGIKASAIESILDGKYTVGPSSLRALHVDGIEVMPRP